MIVSDVDNEHDYIMNKALQAYSQHRETEQQQEQLNDSNQPNGSTQLNNLNSGKENTPMMSPREGSRSSKKTREGQGQGQNQNHVIKVMDIQAPEPSLSNGLHNSRQNQTYA